MPHLTDPSSVAFRRALSDRLGIGASVLCLLHCLALPFLLTGASAWAASEAAHGLFHLLLFVAILPLAVGSALPGYREHRDRGVLWLLGGGVVVLVLGLLSHELAGVAAERVLTVAGSLLIVTGHVRNWQARKRCAHHRLPHHAAHCD